MGKNKTGKINRLWEFYTTILSNLIVFFKVKGPFENV